MDETKKLKLKKPSYNNPADIQIVNSNMDSIDKEMINIDKMLELKAEKAEMLEQLAILDEKIDSIESSGGGGSIISTLPFHNKNTIEVGVVEEPVFALEVNLAKSSNLSMHLLINGRASEDLELTIGIFYNEIKLGFSPLTDKVQEGPFLIGIPSNILQAVPGSNMFKILMKTSAGTVTVEDRGIWGSLDGEHILGGATSEVPHIFIIEELKKLKYDISENIDSKINIETQKPVPMTVKDEVKYKKIPYEEKIKGAVSIKLAKIK